MEDMTNKEYLYFDPTDGRLRTSKPANDKAIAVDMNKQGSGGFFTYIAKGRARREFIRYPNMAADLQSLDVHCIVLNLTLFI